MVWRITERFLLNEKSFQKKFYDDATKKYDVEHEKWTTNDDKENEISMEKDIYNDRED